MSSFSVSEEEEGDAMGMDVRAWQGMDVRTWQQNEGMWGSEQGEPRKRGM